MLEWQYPFFNFISGINVMIPVEVINDEWKRR